MFSDTKINRIKLIFVCLCVCSGRGSYAHVFKVQRQSTGEHYALKVYRQQTKTFQIIEELTRMRAVNNEHTVVVCTNAIATATNKNEPKKWQELLPQTCVIIIQYVLMFVQLRTKDLKHNRWGLVMEFCETNLDNLLSRHLGGRGLPRSLAQKSSLYWYGHTGDFLSGVKVYWNGQKVRKNKSKWVRNFFYDVNSKKMISRFLDSYFCTNFRFHNQAVPWPGDKSSPYEYIHTV